MLYIPSEKDSNSRYQKFHAYLIECSDIPAEVQKRKILEHCKKYKIDFQDIRFFAINKFLFELDFPRDNTGIIVMERTLIGPSERDISNAFDICDKKVNCIIFIVGEATVSYDIAPYIIQMFSNIFGANLDYLRKEDMYFYINRSNITFMARNKRGILREMINEGILEEFLIYPQKLENLDEEFKTELLKMSKKEPFDDSNIDLKFLADSLGVKIGPIRLDGHTQIF
jgi:hypothetical protein